MPYPKSLPPAIQSNAHRTLDRSRKAHLVAATLAALSLAIANSTNANTTATWNGSVGLWDDATAWSTNPIFPNNAGATLYDVFINAGDVSSNVNVTVQNLSLTSASLSGSRNITVAGLLSVNDGAILTGAGVITTASVNFAASTTPITWSSGRAITSTGAATWSGNATMTLANGNDYTNQGTFSVNTSGNASWTGGTFINSGTFLKNSSDNTSIFTFNNSGTVTINAGSLGFNGGGTHTGSFTTSGAGLLAFSGLTHNFNAGSSITSANTVTFSAGNGNLNSGSVYNVSGTTNISGASVTFAAGAVETSLGATVNISAGALTLNATGTPSIPTLNLSGGTLQGSQSVTVPGTFNWSGGTIAGSGTLSASTLAINLSANAALSGTRSLISTTAATWTSSGTFNVSTAGANIFTSGGTFSINTSVGGNWSGGTFNNQGALTKISADANAITSIFNNSGSVAVSAGTLSLGGGGNHTGAFSTTPAGTLAFSGGTHNLNSGSSITAGTLLFSAGTDNLNSGSAYNAATTTIAGATVTFAPGATLTSLGTTLTVSGGTLNLNDGSTPSVPTLNITGGTFQGSDNFSVTGTLTWTGNSNINGAGTLTVKDLAINLTAGVSMAGTRSLVSTGAATWNSTGIFNINLGNSNAYTNQGTFTVNTTAGGNIGGGTINNPGTLTKLSADANNFTGTFNNTGSLVVAAGTLQLNTITQFTTATTSTLTAGTWEIDDTATLLVTGGPTLNITTNNANVTLSGPNSIFARIDTLATNNGSFHLLANRSFTASTFTNNGTLELGGGTFSATILTNNAAATLKGFGTISVRPINHGTIQAQGGTLTFSDGINGASGTLTINPGGTADLSAGASGSSADTLLQNGNTPNSLILGNNNLLLKVGYSNANFGVGNTFNKHANISTSGGGGQILADGGNTQILSGSLTAGGTATPAIDFGHVHVTDILTRTYQISNVGTSTGPAVLYALQTSTGGGNITDSRLSGSGATSSNVGPVAYNGTSSSLGVTFTASTDGPLTAQTLHIANNFDNIPEQTLSITGIAYNLAAPVISGNPVSFANHHVGDVVAPVAISVKNNAPNNGFSESLDGSLTNPLGNIAIAGPGFSLLAPQSTDTSITATLDTTSAGSKSGSANLTLISNGSGTSGLPNTPISTLTLSSSGAVYRLAQPSTIASINLGTLHVGDSGVAHPSISNLAANDSFSENLTASFGTAVGPITPSGGPITILPGATNSTLTVTLDTSTAALARTGNVPIHLNSDGTGSSGLGITARPDQTFTLTANILNFAQANIQKFSGNGSFTPNASGATLDFGVLTSGATVSTALTLLNTALAPADTLAGNWTLAAPDFSLSNFTPFTGLVAGTSLNGPIVSFTASASGIFSETVTLHPLSQNDAPFSGSLPDFTLTLKALVNPLTALWNGSTGNWSDATRWNTNPQSPANGSPTGAIYNVTIAGGNVTLNVNPTIGTLTLSAGTLSGAGNLTLSGGTLLGTYNVTGTTTLAAGTLVVGGTTHNAGPFDGPGTLSINSGATLIADRSTVASLVINGAMTIRRQTPSITSKVTTLTIAGSPNNWTGRLDLANNNLIVAGIGTNIPNQLKQAAHLGAWNGTGGITSSSAQAAATSSTATALAYATGAQFTANSGQTQFAGQPFLPTDTLIMYTLAGDANMDKSVTFADFLQLQNHYNQPTTDWQGGDFNYDTSTTFADFLILQNNYNKTLTAANLLEASPTSVPEPTSLLLLLLPLTLTRRRPNR